MTNESANTPARRIDDRLPSQPLQWEDQPEAVRQERAKKAAELANAMADAGAAFLAHVGTGGGIAAIPHTGPAQYVVAGTMAAISKVLGGQTQTAGAARQGGNTCDLTDYTTAINYSNGTSTVLVPLASQSQAAQPTKLTDEQIIELAVAGHMSSDDYDNDQSTYCLNFARAIEREVLPGTSQATKAQVEPGETNCTLNGGDVEGNQVFVSMDSKPSTHLWTVGGRAYLCEVAPQAPATREAKDEQQANELMRKALEDIAQPADFGCGCSFPCQCNSDGAEVINAGVMRDIAADALAEVERLCCAQREDKNAESSDVATTTSTVSAPLGYVSEDAVATLSAGSGVLTAIIPRAINGADRAIYAGAQKAPEEVRNQALEEAASLCDEERHSVSNYAGMLATRIRALKRPTSTDTGSAA